MLRGRNVSILRDWLCNGLSYRISTLTVKKDSRRTLGEVHNCRKANLTICASNRAGHPIDCRKAARTVCNHPG